MRTEMQLLLLGPFEVVTDLGEGRLPGRGERALLALLALSAGQVVPTNALVDALWSSGDLPVDPANALHVRVSKLRRALAALDPRDLVRRDGSGYRLDLDPASVDAHRFAALVEAARSNGDPQAAVDCYGQALSMWRGDPLVDFAGATWTLVESGRLAELRLAAIAERADRLLTLGRFEQTVADLEPVVAAHPTRERLVGQLMTALFNAGRQADALAVYAGTRHALTEELGLDPSRELRSVMEQVLRHDPAIARGATSVPRPRPAASDAEPAPSAPAATSSLAGLPLRLTSFVGRDEDLDNVQRALARSRLVTLTGPGGAGKTALGIEAARHAGTQFRDGARLVRLAGVAEADLLPQAVADALGLSIEGGTAVHHPLDVLVGRLARRNMLVVLDNCEHVIDPVSSLVETVLEHCPDVRVLATSREALAVPGELQFPVAPLAVPDPDTAPGDVPDYPAVRLFLDRAEAAAPGRVVDADALAAVAIICRRLDGIPLALELAAARSRSLTPTELAERVKDRFGVLTSGNRTADARQQTLRATIDWSHDLLTVPARVLFRRLAVFHGGWTLAGAEAVVPTGDLPPDAVLDMLDRLVKQSLVLVEPGTHRTRYRMLETLRQYADDRLADAGERNAVAAEHAKYYLELGERAESGLRGRSQGQWAQTLREEHPNLRAALAWLTVTEGQADAALNLAGSLGLYWHLGRHLEGRQILRRVMTLPGGSAHSRARAMQAVSLVERPRACIVHPSEQCAAAAEDSLRVFEAMGDRPRAALSRLLLAVEGVGANPRVRAGQLLDEADQEFAALGDPWGRAVVAFVRMEIQFKRGTETAARQAATEAVGLFRALQDGWGLSGVLYHYGYGVQRFGAYADAVPILQEAIEVAAAAGVHNTVQWATADLGLAHLALGQIDEASACFARAGAVSDQVGDHAGRVLGLYAEALRAVQDGDHARAGPLFDRARAGFERLGVWLATGLALAGLADCQLRTGDLDAARERFSELLRLADTTGEIGLLCLALEGTARVTVPSDATAAAEMLARAAALRTRYDRPASGPEKEAALATDAAARLALGDSAHQAAVLRGAARGVGSSSMQ
jgi:predicted ATPase/DNA-binding SARP family transcriptional activator